MPPPFMGAAAMQNSDSNPAAAVERWSAIIFGGVLLLVATSLCGWGVRLSVAGLTAASWPPGLGQLLLPVGATALVIGFGAWRLLRMGAPERLFGLSLGWAIVTAFGAAAVIGALI